MIIEKLRVKNYKSLEDVEVPLRPLTVFVGPNNSGKSNILDCLEFVKDLAFSRPTAMAVAGRGGFTDLVWGGDHARAIDIQLDGRVADEKGQQRLFTYEVEITGPPTGYIINKEVFTLFEGGTGRRLLERTGDAQVKTWSEQDPSQETGVWGLGEPRLGIYQVGASQDPRHRTLASFASAVENWGFFRFAPSDMGSPGPARKEAYLSEEGQNLASILISIQSEDRRTFAELESYLNTALPEVEDFSVGLTEDNRAFFRWREAGLPSDFRVKSWMSSDGTRQILGLLALVFAPRMRPLLTMEEPENFIHPGLLELVAGLLKSISMKTQTLVSTHSPYLLNYLSPEDLVVVEKKDGRTRVTSVKDREGIKEAIRVLGLGELWFSGHLGGVP